MKNVQGVSFFLFSEWHGVGLHKLMRFQWQHATSNQNGGSGPLDLQLPR